MKLSRGAKWALGVGLLGVFIVAALKEPPKEKDPLSAYKYFCNEAVLKSLHDPDSAQMVYYREWPAERKKDGTVMVLAVGRAKNRLGAYVKSQWYCEARSEGDKIRLVRLREVKP